VEAPDVRYARSGTVSIAYQVVGDGPVDLLYIPGWISHLDLYREEPSVARFLRRLAAGVPLERFRGREIERAGDGVFATFDGPARAIRCAREIAREVRRLGLEIRAGVTGGCELADGCVTGIAVHVGAQVRRATAGRAEGRSRRVVTPRAGA